MLERLMGGDPVGTMAALNARVGLPLGLDAMGVTEDMMEDVSDAALKDHCHATNPRTPTARDYLQMLDQSR